ncbi:MAG: nicotinate phosphoribosyltransferase [Myxococcota bacterium]|nr:nicotinate phosphoribosyltransferase [Myxococcota bacterium]
MARPFFAPDKAGLQCDLYQLVQSAVYHADGLWGEVTFDLSLTSLPETCAYAVVAGVQEALDEVQRLRFSDEEIQWLQQIEVFQGASQAWWESLRHFRFSGDIDGLPDGSVAFLNEPILRVTAPLTQAVLLETRLIQAIAHATGVATRAARLVQAADGRRIFDFGSRRLPGPQAALRSARAAAIAGCAGTSYALAGEVYGIPVMGTLSQGFLAAYPSDTAAIDAFALHFPKVGYISLPGDSFEAGVAQLAEHRESVRIVRVDHWDLDMASRNVRKALDAHGMESVSILGSGALQESTVLELTRKKAPVDLYAIGRELALGDRQSEFTLNYRIAEMWRGAELEFVTRRGASMYPGLKQLLRGPKGDLLCLEDELDLLDLEGHRALLVPLLREGELVRSGDSIEGVQNRLRLELSVLPNEVRDLEHPGHWPVQPSDRLARAALS